jgi:hypothetical protein
MLRSILPSWSALGLALLYPALVLCSPAAALAETGGADADWYVVGSELAAHDRGFLDGPMVEPRPSLSVTTPESFDFVFNLGDEADGERVSFTAGRSLRLDSDGDTYTFLMSRSFGLETGTALTPSFTAGIGFTYLDQVPTVTRGLIDGSGSWQPAMQFGFGATYDLSASLAVTARYRALMLGGEALATSAKFDPRVTQDFMIGARLRF